MDQVPGVVQYRISVRNSYQTQFSFIHDIYSSHPIDIVKNHKTLSQISQRMRVDDNSDREHCWLAKHSEGKQNS